MPVTLPVLIAAAVASLALGALAAWIAASARAHAAAAAFLEEDAARKSEIAQLREQCQRLPELKRELEEAAGQRQQAQAVLADLRQTLGSLEATTREQQARIGRREEEWENLQAEHGRVLQRQSQLFAQIEKLNAELDGERRQSAEKLALLAQAKEELSNQFKAVAGEILDEKTKKFTEQNQSSLGQLLHPLKTQIEDFRKRVDEVYAQEGKDRSALANEVQGLMKLNRQLSEDAENLTRALKGSSKIQGNWGELILERILESSGLRKDHEYTVQESHTREDRSRVQPDVVIHLPEDRHLVVDSKVSLTAYEEYVRAEDEAQRSGLLARHIGSVRAHIKGLSEKNYQNLYGCRSLDCVVMFVPIDAAFLLATSAGDKLWQEAWERNILIVSPSMLLFVVRTVAQLWRQEQQTENAQKIASRGAALYEKLAGFVSEMEGVGTGLARARDSYEEAVKKLATGRGSVLRQAEMLKELGVQTGKQLPPSLLALSEDESPSPAENDTLLTLAAASSTADEA